MTPHPSRPASPMTLDCPAPGTLPSPLRALVVEDGRHFREALAMALEVMGIMVVGEAADGQSGIVLAREVDPDIVLLDLRLPDQTGTEVTLALRRELSRAHVIIVSAHRDLGYVQAAFEAGASAFVAKDAAASDLGPAIACVLAGRRYVSDCVAGGAELLCGDGGARLKEPAGTRRARRTDGSARGPSGTPPRRPRSARADRRVPSHRGPRRW
ncbi:MAG: response regulator transcription factor [Myxococcota bacterium]